MGMSISGSELQRLMCAATRACARSLESGARIDPFGADPPTATEVAITVCAMLESVGIEPFELGLWRSWGRPASRGQAPGDVPAPGRSPAGARG
ncbi:MAG TPA: hypothetical protein VKV27_17255 [Solirubrobacteraceae bacterium]|nr:hypothetical protein [Solirubrobacteraceae bacterium]